MTSDIGRAWPWDLPRLVEAHRETDRRRALAAAPDLTYLFWESTLRCNLRCTHCGSSCEAHTPLRELTTGEVCGILDTIAEDLDATRMFVSITGGEPILRPDLAEVVAHMTRLGMRCCIVTNGTLLTPSVAARLYDAGMRTVTVSVDGLEGTHEAVRGRGTYPKALAALGHARDAGFTAVEAITCVRPANLPELPAIERAVRAAGANLFRVITIDRMGRIAGQEAPDLWLRPPEVRLLLDWVARRRAELAAAGEYVDVRFSCGGFLGLQREGAVRPGDSQCMAGLCVASILADGQVGACPSIPRAYAQGSALTERFSTIWRERFQLHRSTAWRRRGPCARCSWFPVCLGGGLHECLVQPDEFCWLDRQTGGAIDR
jgi:radical SAM protein with 4Fe4S-binding SPASM domain